MRRREHISSRSCLLHRDAVASIVSILGAVFLAACSSSFTLDRPLTPQPQDWLQEGGGAGRGGHVSVADDDRPADIHHGDVLQGDVETVGPAVNWEYSQDGAAGRAAPLFVDDAVLFFSTTGMVEMVDARSGDEIGSVSCGWFIHATPAVSNGHLFVATAGADPLLFCFDLAGRIKRYERRFPSVHAALCAVDGGVVVVSRGGRVSFFSTEDSAAVWITELEDVVAAAPAASDTLVVIAGQNGDLTACSLRDGTKRWRQPTGAAFIAGPTVRDGAIAAVNSVGTLVLAGLHDGELRWSRSFDQPVWQSPAWRGDTIALALSGGDVVLLHAADGRELTRYALGELPGAAPLFAGNHILQLLRSGQLMAIDLADGGIEERARLSRRSETPVLVTSYGIVMVDEEGEAVCFR